MYVEASALAFREGIREFLVCFAQDAMLGILEGLSVLVSLTLKPQYLSNSCCVESLGQVRSIVS